MRSFDLVDAVDPHDTCQVRVLGTDSSKCENDTFARVPLSMASFMSFHASSHSAGNGITCAVGRVVREIDVLPISTPVASTAAPATKLVNARE